MEHLLLLELYKFLAVVIPWMKTCQVIIIAIVSITEVYKSVTMKLEMTVFVN